MSQSRRPAQPQADGRVPHAIPWGRALLPSHARVEAAPYHWCLVDLLDSQDRYVAAVCPRGHAKTTITCLIWLLREIAYGRARYVLLVADTRDQAAQYLDDIRREIDDNTALRMLYPQLAPGAIWRGDDIVFAGGARVRALGIGQRVRGRKHGGTRPDLIILDDAENDEAVSSQERRTKLHRWFYAALLPALAPGGRVRVVGTILHRDSLLARLVRTQGWTSRIWRALQDDGTALWPEWMPASELLRLRAMAEADGTLDVWYQEYQGVSRAPEGAVFQPSDIRYFEVLPTGRDGEPIRYYRSLYVDPAISQGDRGDYTGYTVVYASHDGYWYVVEAFRRRHDPAEILDTIFLLARKHSLDTIGIESVAYQRALAFWARARAEESREYLPIETVTPDSDKRRRILALHPFFRQGRVLLRSTLPSRLEEELLYLDETDHDDVADSLAGHLFITIRPEPPAVRERQYADAASGRAARHRRELERQARLRRRGIDAVLSRCYGWPNG